MPKRKTQAEVDVFMDEIGCTLVSGGIPRSRDRVRIRHNICGAELTRGYGALRNKRKFECPGCPGSMLRTKLTTEQVKARLLEKQCTLVGRYKSTVEPVLCIHWTCGKMIKVNVNGISVGRGSCYECGIKASSWRKQYSWDKVDALFRNFDCELLETNNWIRFKPEDKLLARHGRCGKSIKVRLRNVLDKGYPCHKCGHELQKRHVGMYSLKNAIKHADEWFVDYSKYFYIAEFELDNKTWVKTGIGKSDRLTEHRSAGANFIFQTEGVNLLECVFLEHFILRLTEEYRPREGLNSHPDYPLNRGGTECWPKQNRLVSIKGTDFYI